MAFRKTKGNETIYLVRDVLTGRVLTAENVTVSDKEMMKGVLAPVIALGVPVLGAISDAQESMQLAIAELWPIIPHQLCQLHVLREASRPIYEQDRKLKVEMRKPIQERVRKVRKQLEQQRQTVTGPEAEQVAMLADYALGIQTAINLEGKQPFDDAGIAVYDAALSSPQEFGRGREKGAAVSQACKQKLNRLQEIVEIYHRWDSSIEQVKRMRAWVLAAEHILDGSWAEGEKEVTNQQVGQRFDAWYRELGSSSHLGNG